MKGQNNCQWLIIGSTELCNKSCIGNYCKIHLARLRQGPGTQPCKECGKGIKNRFRFCYSCGYNTVRMSDWHKRHGAFLSESKRLGRIDISN